MTSVWLDVKKHFGHQTNVFYFEDKAASFLEITFLSELSWLHTSAKSTIPTESLIADTVKRSLSVLAHRHRMAIVAFIHTLINI